MFSSSADNICEEKLCTMFYGLFTSVFGAIFRRILSSFWSSFFFHSRFFPFIQLLIVWFRLQYVTNPSVDLSSISSCFTSLRSCFKSLCLLVSSDSMITLAILFHDLRFNFIANFGPEKDGMRLFLLQI